MHAWGRWVDASIHSNSSVVQEVLEFISITDDLIDESSFLQHFEDAVLSAMFDVGRALVPVLIRL
jgi:hypothetical protein